MLKTKRQTIKLKKIIRDGNKHKKQYGVFTTCIQLIDDRIIAINYKENTNEYLIALMENNKALRVIYYIYEKDLAKGVQKALLDNNYKVAVI